MRMIELRNVSKFYYNKGIIASGISGVNLDLDVGEFVVITGESGSGKSTLLNVIAGLDTYEEGEMYVDGHETSHYTAADFERYRQKYISVIFQNYNLVSSYTVYQNVALAMQIEGSDSAEIRKKVPGILEKVGLLKQRNQKVSKLSGGQKQRVAIARALAKDTKIMVADEPTGNLDSESAAGIVDLLTEIASDRLVIVVTHNYDQFRDHASRVIRMHDGRIIEDTGKATARNDLDLSNVDAKESEPGRKRGMPYATHLRLGVRNTFNIPAKFLLLLLVFLFVTGSIAAQYVTVRKQQDTVSETGWNDYFTNYSPKRIVVERQDRNPFTRADYEALENAPHVDKLVHEDAIFDSSVFIQNDQISFSGYMMNIADLDKKPDLGDMPKADNEVVLEGIDDGWSFGDRPDQMIGQTYTVTTDDETEREIVVAGIVFMDDGMDDGEGSEDEGSDDVAIDEDDYYYESEDGRIYFTDHKMIELRSGLYAANSRTTMLIGRTMETLTPGAGGLVVNDNVPEGYILLPTSYDEMFDEGYAAGAEVMLRVKSLYYESARDLVVMGTYGEKTFTKKTGLENLADHNGEIFINSMDYRRLYEKGSFQTSVFIDDTSNMAGMKDMLTRGGYHVLVLKDHIYNFISKEIVDVIQLPVAVIVSLAVFFIAYFVIRLILKSRSVYFATLRMIGLGKEAAHRIMRVELILVCMISYGLFLLFIYLDKIGVLNSSRLNEYLTYLTMRDYIILAVILLVMAVLISGRFMNTIFRKSAMGTYREEA